MERFHSASSITFVEASAAHLQDAKVDMQRIREGGGVARASTQAGIAADIHNSSSFSGRESSTTSKRAREEGHVETSLEHCSLLQLLFPHEDIRSDIELLELDRSKDGAAVAFLLPMKWSIVHVAIVPILPASICYGMDVFPRSWDEFLSKTASHLEVRRQSLAAVVEVRNRVITLLCTDGLQTVLLNQRLIAKFQGRFAGLRWSGDGELAKARDCFSKKRKDGALVCPMRVGFVPQDSDPLLNAPALHIMTSDGLYASESSMLWQSAFSTVFEDAAPRGSLDQDLDHFLKVIERQAALKMLDRVALRKRLARCSDIPCPLCGKQFLTLEETSRHWLSKCLPSAAASIQLGSPLFL
ncbi:Hypothetical protein, putative [Bodo saltans]|uniref:Uncharacterized protein n=1 Tax=Bodo saltans TaxID=75058 RepID=A0A0S4IKY6_BODSA|nr:Hypothetical protein, putative [Bodo saltans]|eukprot:CUE69796.1 Hypothetical protein, putative [Bodo saltans]